MMTNFKQVDPDPDMRTGTSNQDGAFCDDRLKGENDRIDSHQWPQMLRDATSNFLEDEKLPPPPSSISSMTVQNVQEHLEVLRKEKARLTTSRDNQNTLPFLPLPLTCDNSFSPTSVINLKKLKDAAKETKREGQVAFSKQSCNYADPWPTPPAREYNLHQQYQQNNHHLNQLRTQYQLQQQQHQLQNQQPYNPQNQSRNQQPYNQQNPLQQQHQLQNQEQYHQQNQLQQYHNPKNSLQQHPPQQEVEFDCLHPRDDQRSKVRFSQSLSVYDNFEGFDYSDAIDANSPTITNRKSLNKEQNDCKLLFMLQRARHCWYSREELKKIKDERKEIVRELRKFGFDASRIDTSVYELRGLEAYLSPETLRTTLKKRKETLEVVFQEQNRQRQSQGERKLNAESLQSTSLRASEWFRIRAYEIAERDAKEAQTIYWSDPEVIRLAEFAKGTAMAKFFPYQHHQDNAEQQEFSMMYEQLNESIGLMDIDDEDAGTGGLNDSTLSFWANSSWTKDLMDE